ncbi:MAG: 6-phosphofructokinase, partial [Thermodesulfobacteriota bacterium]
PVIQHRYDLSSVSSEITHSVKQPNTEGGSMSAKSAFDVEMFLKNKKVRQLVGNVNRELTERRKFRPPRCVPFSCPCTLLKEDTRYRFHLDKEAQRRLPDIIYNRVQNVVGIPSPGGPEEKQFRKERNIGIVFSGGPAPGGHNVIAGLYDAAKKANPGNRIFGFLMGPDGVIENEAVELDGDLVDRYRNMGGFTMIKTGRTKIDSKEKVSFSRESCRNLGLDALIIVGGDDSNTNAAFLAQELKSDGVQVIGVPKTIDGDIQVRDTEGNVLCAMSFGFHSAARSFAGSISNLCTDCSSDVKYWHICKVMGRVASHLALEVALQSHANITLIGEDLADYIDKDRMERSESLDYNAYGITLRHLSRVICDGIVRRAAAGKNYGVLVIPEGVLEFINEVQVFIIKLNTIITEYNKTHDTGFHADFTTLEEKRDYLRRLARRAREEGVFSIWNTRDDDLFDAIPEFFQEGLLTERDSHGNFQFSLVETDKVIMGLVKDYLKVLREKGIYKIGIEDRYFRKVMEKEGLDPDRLGPILFTNFGQNRLLLMKESIISQKTLKQVLEKEKVIRSTEAIPAGIKKVFEKSIPKFKTQLHFYGYDGRGSDPTRFDCIYAYNLGQTAFSLLANGATGQMAAIRNLEKDFSRWEPIGIPIAPLMHLEERGGKMSLVLERTVVDTHSPAFQVVKALREKWLSAEPGPDDYRKPAPVRFSGKGEEDRPMTLTLNNLAHDTF